MYQAVLLLHFLATAVLVTCLLVPAAGLLRPLKPVVEALRGQRMPDLSLERCRWTAGVCLVILLITGLPMLDNWSVGARQVISADFYETRFGRLLVIKTLGSAALAVGLYYPRWATSLVRFNLLLGLFLILVSVHIVR